MDNQLRAPLWEALINHINKKKLRFHTPGHQGGEFVDQGLLDYLGQGLFNLDLTEVPGLDNLYCPQDAIMQAQKLAAKVHGAMASHFLVNGTTAGIIAMFLAALAPGKVIAIPRNCHVSVINGLILSGTIPVFIEPEVDREQNIVLGITTESIKKTLTIRPDITSVLLLNPNYFGICGLLQQQVDLCHQQDKLVMVDEAHGAHFCFHPHLPLSAMEAGAEICSQSYHKTLGSFTQSSILHIGESFKNTQKVIQAVSMVQSTSPSYVLMASLDTARRQMAVEGDSLWERTIQMAQELKRKINQIKGFRCLEIGNKEFTLDLTRVSITAEDMGLAGDDLASLLSEKYQVDVELSLGPWIVLIITPGTTNHGINKLIGALEDISRHFGSYRPLSVDYQLGKIGLPKLRMAPRKAWFAAHKTVSLRDSMGQIAAQVVAPCPPGVPLLIPGEEISPEIAEYLNGKISHIDIVDG